nr:hypothetical protein [Tanacetum cinerariifolium]
MLRRKRGCFKSLTNNSIGISPTDPTAPLSQHLRVEKSRWGHYKPSWPSKWNYPCEAPPGALPMPMELYETHTYAEVVARIQGLVGHPPNNFTLDYQRYGWGRRAPLRTQTDWDLLVRYQPPHLAQMRVNIKVTLIGAGPNLVVNPSVGPIPPNISDGEDEFDSEESDGEEHVEFAKFQTGVGGRRGRGLGGAALAGRGEAVGGVVREGKAEAFDEVFAETGKGHGAARGPNVGKGIGTEEDPVVVVEDAGGQSVRTRRGGQSSSLVEAFGRVVESVGVYVAAASSVEDASRTYKYQVDIFEQ